MYMGDHRSLKEIIMAQTDKKEEEARRKRAAVKATFRG
jgi:hypothetical protein